MHLIRKALVEFIGAFALVFVGVLSAYSNPGNLTSQALAEGLTMSVFVCAFSPISRAMFNPVLSLGVWLAGGLASIELLAAITAQLAGAFVAGIWSLAFVGVDAVRRGTPGLASGLSHGAGLGIEAVLTFFLVLVALATAIDSRGNKTVAGWSVGLTVTLGMLAGGSLTGAAMNPCRVLGPAMASNSWNQPLIYVLGPLLGAVGAGLLYRYVLLSKSTT